jgi:hypothetical protein
MYNIEDIDKNKVNSYLLEVYSTNPLQADSVYWGIVLNLINQDVFIDGVDINLAFASRYIILINSGKTTSKISNQKQASISVGHLSISGLSGSDVAGNELNIATELYNTMLLKDESSSVLMQFNEPVNGCGCGGLSD